MEILIQENGLFTVACGLQLLGQNMTYSQAEELMDIVEAFGLLY